MTEVLVVTHPQAGVIGVFENERAWEQFIAPHRPANKTDEDSGYELEWVPVNKENP